jgi:hypothetical protein
LKTIFHAGRQLKKLRIMMPCALPWAPAGIWLGVHLAETYGLNPGDGGVLAPLPVRLAWAVGVSLLGISITVGMWLYGKCYVAKMELDEQAGTLSIDTVRFFGTRTEEVQLARVQGSRYHEGYLDLPRAPLVHAPWWTIRIAGRKLPLILDRQGELIDLELLKRLLKSDEKSVRYSVLFPPPRP